MEKGKVDPKRNIPKAYGGSKDFYGGRKDFYGKRQG